MLRRSPATTALFVDFDGTLSPIVARADAARPLPGVAALLVALGRRFAVVAVVSGRPVSFLAAHLPGEVELHGLYGLEARIGGVHEQHAAAEAWRGAIDDVAHQAATTGPDGIDVEHKGLSVTLHLRRRPDLLAPTEAWAVAAATRTGLSLRAAKASFELHPPVAVDKGTVVEARSAGMTAAAYLGDDAGDLPAFDALDRLSTRGMATVKVAVATVESVASLTAAADVVVDGPAGAVGFLAGLLSSLSRPPS